jgi:hypothetical protein
MVNPISNFVKGYKKAKSLYTICEEEGFDFMSLEQESPATWVFLNKKGIQKEDLGAFYLDGDISKERKVYAIGATVYLMRKLRQEVMHDMKETTKEYIIKIKDSIKK